MRISHLVRRRKKKITGNYKRNVSIQKKKFPENVVRLSELLSHTFVVRLMRRDDWFTSYLIVLVKRIEKA